jgi:hypothetical protein
MALPPAPKASLVRRLRQAVAGLTALACLLALFFMLLKWRVNRPELHLNFGGIASDQAAGQSDE